MYADMPALPKSTNRPWTIEFKEELRVFWWRTGSKTKVTVSPDSKISDIVKKFGEPVYKLRSECGEFVFIYNPDKNDSSRKLEMRFSRRKTLVNVIDVPYGITAEVVTDLNTKKRWFMQKHQKQI